MVYGRVWLNVVLVAQVGDLHWQIYLCLEVGSCIAARAGRESSFISGLSLLTDRTESGL